MAKSKRKKKHRIRFELSIGGLLGLGIITFCVFLWMFLLGIWAGQTVLLPAGERESPSFSRMASSLWEQGKAAAGGERKVTPVSPAPVAEADDPMALEAEPDLSGSSFFSLQVGSYQDAGQASRAAKEWQGRGYEAFSLPPEEGGDGAFRVCVGRYEELAQANTQAGRLEDTEKIKAFITLIPAAQVKNP